MPRGVDTRDRLFKAAVDLIGEKGYHGTTVDEIVERAGLAKGTVYYHFRSKAELLSALLYEGLERLAKAFRAEAAEAPTPERALQAVVRAELTYIERYQPFSKLLLSEMWRTDREWRDSLRRLREDYVTVVREVLDDGVELGAFSRDLDTGIAASAIFGMTATVALDWLVFEPERDLDDVCANLQRLVDGAVRR